MRRGNFLQFVVAGQSTVGLSFPPPGFSIFRQRCSKEIKRRHLSEMTAFATSVPYWKGGSVLNFACRVRRLFD